MKQPILYKIVCILVSICLLLPATLLTTNHAAGNGEKSNDYMYVYREGESWDHSYDNYSGLNWENINDDSIAQSASDGAYTDVQSVEGAGDYAEWDFNVHQAGTYEIWVRGYHSIAYNICESIILEWNGSQINDDPQDWHKVGQWTWSCFGNVTCAADTLATIRIKSLDEGWVPVDKLLITNDTGYNPSGIEDDVGSITHDIGERPPSWGDIVTDLDYNFIYNTTETLSRVIFDSYDEDVEIAKGRAFGTPGEHDAADQIIIPAMKEIGIHTSREKIKAYPGNKIDNQVEIQWTKLSVYNETSQVEEELVDYYITPQYNESFGVWRIFKGLTLNFDYNFLSFNMTHNVSIIIREPTACENFTNLINQSVIDDINNNISDCNFSVFADYMFNLLENQTGVNFSELTEDNVTEIYESVFSSEFCSGGEEDPYMEIEEDPAFNPKTSYFINFPTYSTFDNFWPRFKDMLYFFLKGIGDSNFRGLIRYDFNNDTHNMINREYAMYPIIYINKSTGEEICKDPCHYRINFTLNQKWNDSVESENIIGTIYGTDPSKTVIVSSFYDSWWNQGTADSAIGMSIVLAIAKYYKENNIIPKYNLKFIAFGGEEKGYKGAESYERRHADEDIIAVIDINQVGFNQTEAQGKPRLTMNVICNSDPLKDNISEIVDRTNYIERTGNVTDFVKRTVKWGAPSNDKPFARSKYLHPLQRLWINTICFLKDKGDNHSRRWVLHHRDGLNHTEGDVMDYYEPDDVKAVADMVLNVTKCFAGESIYLYTGWNLINIPLNNSWMASTLTENITGCQMISWFDSENQTYKTYIVEVPGYDFTIKDGYGLFILVNQTSIISMSGDIITSVSIPLKVGWNMIGWYHDYSTTASDLASSITGCEMISWFDASNQTFKTHIVGVPGYDFNITKGMGIYVLTNANSIWYGDDNGEGGESEGGEESEGGSTGLPYPIYGRAFYRNQSNPVESANLTIINLNTNGTFNTLIPFNSSGYYNEDLGQLNPSGWDNSDIIRIIVNGTGNYSGWTGQKDIILNTSIPGEHVPDIYLNPTNISLLTGWNLVTVPLSNTWNASDLVENITGCQSISRWDAVNQSYHSYIKDNPLEFDFSIDDGIGYYINANQTSVLSWLDSGDPITNASINYETGWNLIGWFNDSSINASSLADDINNSDSLEPDQYVVSIGKWNSGNQTYQNYTLGDPPSKDFEIIKGMGIVVDIHNTSGGGCGSNPGIPHTIWGYTYYLESNIHANNANVVIRNKNTSEQIYTNVGGSASGYYMQELSNLQSGWSSGDIITISIDSTDEDIYEGWAGYKEITANNSLGNQKIENIMVYGEGSTVIRDDNGSEESTVMLDNSTDEVLKNLDVDSDYLEKASSAKLWIYAKADGEDMENSSHKITVNNDSKYVIFFDPMATFGDSYGWQSFDIELEWLTLGNNTFSVVDAYTTDRENNLLIGIDTENDHDMSQWKEASGSLPPADECEGELMMVLQLFY
jgi:hypothetical protein